MPPPNTSGTVEPEPESNAVYEYDDEHSFHATFAERTAELKIENGRLKNRVQELAEEVDPLRAELQRCEYQLKCAQNELEEERTTVATISDLRQSEKAEATKEVANLREQLEGLRTVLEEERAVELQKLRSELDFTKAQVGNKHWKSEKADLVAQIDDLNAQLRAAKKQAAAVAPVPEGVPGLSVDPAQVEKMLAETATEIRHLQSQVEHWKQKAAAAADAANVPPRPEAAEAAAEARSAAALKDAEQKLRATESLLEEQDALQTQQVDVLKEAHDAEIAKLNKQVLGLQEKLAVQQTQSSAAAPQLTPAKGTKRPGNGGASSAADPLLREQQKLKKQLSDLRRELTAKKDETRRLEDDIASMKSDATKARKARAAEKKRWQDDQDLLREQVENMQSEGSDMRAMIEAIEAQTRSLSADVSLWQERAASEQKAKETLQAYLDELRSAGRAKDEDQGRPPLAELVEQAVTTALQRGEHPVSPVATYSNRSDGNDSTNTESRRRLVSSLAKTEVMARRLKAMVAEVETSVTQPLHPSTEEWQELSPQRHRRSSHKSFGQRK